MEDFFETTTERGRTRGIMAKRKKEKMNNFKEEANNNFKQNNIPVRAYNKLTINLLVSMSVLAVLLIAIFVGYFIWGVDNNKFKSDLTCPEIPPCPSCNCPAVDLSKIKPSICNPNITCPSLGDIFIEIDDKIINYSGA